MWAEISADIPNHRVEKADGKHWKKTAKSDNDKVTSDIKDN